MASEISKRLRSVLSRDKPVLEPLKIPQQNTSSKTVNSTNFVGDKLMVVEVSYGENLSEGYYKLITHYKSKS